MTILEKENAKLRVQEFFKTLRDQVLAPQQTPVSTVFLLMVRTELAGLNRESVLSRDIQWARSYDNLTHETLAYELGKYFLKDSEARQYPLEVETLYYRFDDDGYPQYAALVHGDKTTLVAGEARLTRMVQELEAIYDKVGSEGDALPGFNYTVRETNGRSTTHY